MTTNLWPDFDYADTPKSPKAIIDQAGAGLDDKTGGVVRFYRTGITVRGNMVEASYTLYCPPLAYHFPFMRAIFPMEHGFPVRLIVESLNEFVAADETQLLSALSEIFNAPSTTNTISRLISLAR